MTTTEQCDRLPFCLPNGITPEVFLQDYWQKKPLLIKNGLPAIIGMFEPEDVLDLAVQEGVSARLITQKQDNPTQWSLKNSPLSESDLQNTPTYWTVLVQNLEAWSPELGTLWQAFDFIPKWQQDDIMVSVAPKGGSVGEHYDEYDVFLAQGFGSRRWTLGKMCDPTPNTGTAFVPNQPIRLLDDMGEIIFDEVLEAGDVLYVPPCLSHHGVAMDDCLTFSFGFRRPNLVQVLDEIADIATTEHALFSPMLLPQAMQDNPNELSHKSIQSIKSRLIELLNSSAGDSIIQTAIAELVSKRQYDLLAFEDEITTDDLMDRLSNGEVVMLNPASRFVLCDDKWYVNGDLICLKESEHSLFVRLIEGGVLTIDDIPPNTLPSMTAWINDSWVVLI
ncbi:cupin domain-containing protein [Moraxella nasovis]|uniref:cupin domain-containing protein n=1 Tax=Moraxella nasovis TaxID=2904121 RepID=UPI001F6018B6|nr:cupin domain-containing protein [Moraxella nasovis]UNU73608.1 cupin domain-containing protein [Moraxella nasovis]